MKKIVLDYGDRFQEYASVEEASKALNINKSTLYSAMRKGGRLRIGAFVRKAYSSGNDSLKHISDFQIYKEEGLPPFLKDLKKNESVLCNVRNYSENTSFKRKKIINYKGIDFVDTEGNLWKEAFPVKREELISSFSEEMKILFSRKKELDVEYTAIQKEISEIKASLRSLGVETK
jgi:hypothetical protein